MSRSMSCHEMLHFAAQVTVIRCSQCVLMRRESGMDRVHTCVVTTDGSELVRQPTACRTS